MKTVSTVKCEEAYRRDGNTKYTPVIKVSGETGRLCSDRDLIKLQLNNSKSVIVNHYDLIQAIKNVSSN